MELLDKIFGGKKKDAPPSAGPFVTITEYCPVATSFGGDVYEHELVRASIDRFATACSKLKPEITGGSVPGISRSVKTSPNSFQTWPTFLYRAATTLKNDCNVYIVPSYGADGRTRTGIWQLYADAAELVEHNGMAVVRFTLPTGERTALPLDEVCIINRYQYKSDFFGAPNALSGTLDLLEAQKNAQKTAIEAGANIRFIGRTTGQLHPDDLKDKRDSFSEANLQRNNSGIALYDASIQDVQQLKPYSYTISEGEMERIKESVYNYFATNEEILQNKYSEDVWNAYYEGEVEPFAVQLGEGLSHMLFTQRERRNNSISFSSNRLAYASSANKRSMIRDMLDRGVFCIDDAREILQLPPRADGKGGVYPIRGEYMDSFGLGNSTDSDTDGVDIDKGSSDKQGEKDFDTEEGQV